MTWHAIIPDTGNEAAWAQPSWSGAMRAIEPRMPLVAPSTGNGVVPVSPQATLAGGLLPSYGIDLYNRIHVIPATLPLGNVIGTQQYAIRVWNAWMRAQRLEELEQVGTEGLTLTGQGAPPLTFAALQERTYTLTVTEDGPPAIDATYTWTFDNGEVVSSHITGSRIVAWCWPPDWTDRVLERLAWLTEILGADDLQEQAVSRRIHPRQEIEFSVWAEKADRRTLEAALWGWGARVWALPLYFDGQQLLVDHAVGADELAIETDTRQFVVGGLAQLQAGVDSRQTETVEVQAIEGDRLVLLRPLSRAWPRGTWVYPMRRARLAPETTMSGFTGAASNGRFRFTSVEPVDWRTDHGLPVYRDLPVLEWVTDWTEDPQLTLGRNLVTIDNASGRPVVFDQAGMPQPEHRIAWMHENRERIDLYRRLLFSLRGQQRPIWVPSGTDDLSLVATMGPAAESMDVDFVGYAAHLDGMPGRRDVRIELDDNTVLYRRITGASVIGGTVERLALGSPPGRTIEPGQVRMISYIAPMVLASDAQEIAFWTGYVANAVSTFRGWRNVL